MTISTGLEGIAALRHSRERPESGHVSAVLADDGVPVGSAVRRRHTPMSGAAVAGMVLGILSVALVFSYLSAVALVAIVLSHVGLRQCERRGRRGWAFAVAGLAMGYGSLALTLLAQFGISTAG